MSKWDLIFIAGAISYALRAFPILVLRRIKMDEESDLIKFFNYAAYSVMGGIIYSALYGERFYRDLTGHFSVQELLKLLIVSIAFLVGAATQSIIKALFTCILLYALLLKLL